MKKNKFFSQILVFGLKDCTFIRRGSEEPLNEFPIYETVINSQDMKLWLCSHPHLWKGENGLKIFEETKNELEKRLVGRKVYVLCLCYEEEEEEEEREMGLREEELCIEIRPTKIPIPQSKIRPDFIPNLANFPSWSWITGQAMRNYKIKTRNKE